MLRIIQNMSAASARSYYSQADYYSEGQELIGRWGGKGAELLGLTGIVDREAFGLLCDNKHPVTGQQLTLRQNDNRTVGYDFNFHAPKSVSLLYELTQDERILEAFRTSVQETMQEIEREAKTRVRKLGAESERVTGNLIWSEFVHFTARPVDGIPDPHLHAHLFTHNATWDSTERAWKAVQFRDIKREAPYFEAAFHARFAQALVQQGYVIERTKQGWELAGLSRDTLEKFSRRTEQIEELAQKKGITNPDQKAELGAKTRQKKAQELSRSELRQEWWQRLSDSEAQAIAQVAQQRATATHPSLNQENSIEHAIEHVFERSAVVPAKELVKEALKQGVGQIDVEATWRELPDHGVILKDHEGRTLATTKTVLLEEQRMLEFAREGRDSRPPLNAAWSIQRTWLNDSQKQAVQQLLNSRDRVIVLQGKAGVGKTTLLQEVKEGIESNGNQIIALAPSATASRDVLRNEGFPDADTVSAFLENRQLQASAREQVLLIDEAGLVGTRTLLQVFDKARELNARILLSGDWQQHKSVERGSPLQLLVEEAGLKPARVEEIQRQRGDYREVVQLLSAGQTLAGYDALDRLGWVEELPNGFREQRIADEYLAALEANKSVLAVSPTHAEGHAVSQAIRARLQSAGRIGSDEITYTRLEPLHLTVAQKSDPLSYQKGDILQFVKQSQGHRAGERITFDPDQPLEFASHADRFQVYRPREIPLAVGETIRITANGKTADGKHRLNNGATYQIAGISAEHRLTLNNGWTIAPEYGHLTHGYVSTSHSAQGRTVDRVLIAQSTPSRGASSQEQAYVSISRGRESVKIFTDDKEALRHMLRRSEDRLSATELVRPLQSESWWRQVRSRWLQRLQAYRRTAQQHLTLPQPQQTRVFHHDR